VRALVVLILTAATSAGAATAHQAAAQRQHASIRPLTWQQKHAVVQSNEWHRGCPVQLGQLRVVTTRYHDWDGQTRFGQIVVNERVAHSVLTVFRRLYRLRFPIRDMAFSSAYGPHAWQSGDVTASFECRDAAPSPCNGNAKGTNWSMHAYGEAIDLNPRENPYVGCGMTRDKTALKYMKRTPYRKGMNGKKVVRAFASVGWGWGGAWSGSTKDYMHFSTNGH
jgi:Ni/Co efflux regulator RcnB